MKWTSEVTICTYRVKKGARDKFVEVLRRHWPTLRKLGLATETPAEHFEFSWDPNDKDPRHSESGTTFVEIFAWANPESADIAHRSPDVIAVWEAMGALVEDRDGRPGVEFPKYNPLKLD